MGKLNFLRSSFVRVEEGQYLRGLIHSLTMALEAAEEFGATDVKIGKPYMFSRHSSDITISVEAYIEESEEEQKAREAKNAERLRLEKEEEFRKLKEELEG